MMFLASVVVSRTNCLWLLCSLDSEKNFGVILKNSTVTVSLVSKKNTISTLTTLADSVRTKLLLLQQDAVVVAKRCSRLPYGSYC